jgi:hypothetical protein
MSPERIGDLLARARCRPGRRFGLRHGTGRPGATAELVIEGPGRRLYRFAVPDGLVGPDAFYAWLEGRLDAVDNGPGGVGDGPLGDNPERAGRRSVGDGRGVGMLQAAQ